MVRASRCDHRCIDGIGIEPVLTELRRDQAGLEELAPRQPGHDERCAEFDGAVRSQRVDRLEAAVADVAVPFERVAEDRCHRLGGGELVVDAERGNAPADVLLGPVGDEPVVEREGVDVEPHLDELEERVGRVLAAAEQAMQS
jgi:hypothetical protein